jgi:hypothetical protein
MCAFRLSRMIRHNLLLPAGAGRAAAPCEFRHSPALVVWRSGGLE